MTKTEVRQYFPQGTLNLWVGTQFYEIKKYIKGYYRSQIKFTEVVRPPVQWDQWNKKVRYAFSADEIPCYFNESDIGYVVFLASDGVVYYKIEEILRR